MLLNYTLRKCIITVVFLIILFASFGQTQTDTIAIQRSGKIFVMNGQSLSPRDLKQVFVNNPWSYEQITVSQTQSTISSILSIGGLLTIGYAIGSPELDHARITLGVVGAGAMITGFVLARSSFKNKLRAVKYYNQEIKLQNENPVSLNAGISSNGIGICLKF